jgi:hypothetical protein
MALISNPGQAGAAAPGHILHIRDGVVLQNYGENRVSEADYGNGILAAIAAANVTGDVVDIGPMRAALVNASINTAGVKVRGHETEIVRSGDYTYMLRLNASDIEVRGLRILGEGIPNTGSGWGMHVSSTANRCIVENCEVSGQRGTTVINGDGTCIRVDGDDCVIMGYVSRDAGYAALSMNNSDRLTVDGANIIDPHRALAITGQANMSWINLRNIRAYRIAAPVVQADGAYLNMNIDDGVSLGELRMTNVSLEDGDMIGAGVSYNDADGHQMFKAQNTTKIIMDNVQLLHGTNAGAGLVRSMYLQQFQANVAPDELIMKNCTLADAFICSEKIGYFHAEDCYFGKKHISDYNEIFYRLFAEQVKFDGCTFNLHGKSKVFAIFDTVRNPDAANDCYYFRNNRFIGSSASSQFVFKLNDGTDNGSLVPSVGRIIFDKSNTIENSGAGEMYHSDDAGEELITDTDANGDLLYDGTLGRHPAPGAGPAYFTGIPSLPVPANGRKVWNVNYDPVFGGVENALILENHKGWIANGGAWRRWAT